MKSATLTKPKKQKIKVKGGEIIQIETNCQVFKQLFDGVELIVEQYPELKLGGHKLDHQYTITELHSGMRILTCDESEDYMQLLINKIENILDVINTERYQKQIERFTTLPSEYEWENMWKELETILQLQDLRKYVTGRLSQNVLELGLLEQEIYLKNRTGQQQSRDKFFNGKSCRTYILENHGTRAIEIIEKLSRY
jgi:hypothetical protein